jgi:hypothetical protein
MARAQIYVLRMRKEFAEKIENVLPQKYMDLAEDDVKVDVDTDAVWRIFLLRMKRCIRNF